MDFSEHFERTYAAIAQSKVYREAIRASMADLPDWVIPFSITSADDLAMIEAELRVRGGQCFVDLACGLGGPGLWIAERTGASMVGVDVSNSAVKAASALASARRLSDRARFKVADITDSGLPDGEFDGLMSVDAIQFVDPQRVVREIARLLGPGAAAVVRTWESVAQDVPLPTLVKDYRPIFEANDLTVREHRPVTDFREREHEFHTEIVRRADALTREIGDVAEALIEESRDSLARERDAPRVRKVWIVAEKIGP